MSSRLPWPQLLVAATATVLLVSPLPAISKSLLGLALLDALHLPFFFVLTLTFHSIATRIKPTWPRQATLIALAGFAVLSELAQAKIGRTTSATDLTNNLFGILLACATIHWASPRSPRQRAAIAIGATLAITLAVYPAINIALAKHLRAQKYPMLGNFEDERDLVYWIPQGTSPDGTTRIGRAKHFAADGSYSLEINTAAAPWAGVHHVPFQTTLPASSRLGFTIHNPGSNFELGIRIDLVIDGTPHRSNHEITAKPGTSQHQIPLAASGTNRLKQPSASVPPNLNLTVNKLVFHLGNRPKEVKLFLDSVRFL